MSTARAKHFRDEDQLDLLFRALSDRTRRALLARLSKGPAVISELARPFKMSLAAIGKHLRALENAGLVSREIEGRTHVCSLRAEAMEDADQWLAHYRIYWDETLDGLETYLDEENS